MATIRMKKGIKFADIYDSPETISQAQKEGWSIVKQIETEQTETEQIETEQIEETSEIMNESDKPISMEEVEKVVSKKTSRRK